MPRKLGYGGLSNTNGARDFTGKTEVTAVLVVLVEGITGGANLTGLSYCVFDAEDVGTASVAVQGSASETTNSNGDLEIEVTGSLALGTEVTVIITNYTNDPSDTKRAAVCYTTVTEQ